MSDLDVAVETVVRRCLAVAEGEEVLVVGDPTTAALCESLAAAARAAGADAVIALMRERTDHGEEPPAPIAAALGATDVFIVPTAKSISHTRARKVASLAGARGATMPMVTADMLARLMAVDFDALGERSRAVAALLSEGSEAHLTCPKGTDLTLDLRGRVGLADDGVLITAGSFGNLPCGEGFISPAGGEGTIAATSLSAFGLADPPARLTVRDGLLADAEGAFGAEFIAALRTHGDAGTNVAELGVGTNDRAHFTGNVLEDEKILGTAHVAFGASAAIGGNVSVGVHLDVVVAEATLAIDGVPVLDGGRYVL